MADEVTRYVPPPTIKEFIKFYRPGGFFQEWIIGPVGSGKTTGIFMKLVYMAKLQEPGKDGVRRSRAVIVRNTMPQLKDTTLASWAYWFRDGQAGSWRETDKKFTLRYDDVECEVLFRPLDTEDDIRRVLSLEVTFALFDEFVEIPRKIIEAVAARCGRYPAKKDGGPTNWGMWGSSNPSTEDNWWFEYLHRTCAEESKSLPNAPYALYLKQPSGLSEKAENLENLPGGKDYYDAQMQGKSREWIKQFIESEWGFSMSGRPVVTTITPEQHFVSGLILNERLPLIIGLDPGLGGSALIYGQLDLDGRLNVLGEQVQSGYGAERLMAEKLRPYMMSRWPMYNLNNIIIAPDPAAANRASSDEKSIVERIKKHFTIDVETNNRLPLRLDAIDYFAKMLTPGGPGLRIDQKHCPILTRALRGGWRYRLDTKKDIVAGIEPEKNAYSHPGDAFGYLCRYFHKTTEYEERYGLAGRRGRPSFKPPPVKGNLYHFR